MSEESYRLTEKGMVQALEILEREGLLPKQTESIDVDAVQLRAACAEHSKRSVAKGGERTNEECAEALLIAYFEAYLEDLIRRIVN